SRRLLALGRPGLIAVHFAGVGIGIVLSVLVIEAARVAGLSVFGQWAMLGLACLACTIPALVLLSGGAGGPGSAAHAGIARHEGSASPAVGQAPAGDPARADASRLLGRLITAYGLFGFGYVVTATFIVEMARGLPAARI